MWHKHKVDLMRIKQDIIRDIKREVERLTDACRIETETFERVREAANKLYSSYETVKEAANNLVSNVEHIVAEMRAHVDSKVDELNDHVNSKVDELTANVETTVNALTETNETTLAGYKEELKAANVPQKWELIRDSKPSSSAIYVSGLRHKKLLLLLTTNKTSSSISGKIKIVFEGGENYTSDSYSLTSTSTIREHCFTMDNSDGLFVFGEISDGNVYDNSAPMLSVEITATSSSNASTLRTAITGFKLYGIPAD